MQSLKSLQSSNLYLHLSCPCSDYRSSVPGFKARKIIRESCVTSNIACQAVTYRVAAHFSHFCPCSAPVVAGMVVDRSYCVVRCQLMMRVTRLRSLAGRTNSCHGGYSCHSCCCCPQSQPRHILSTSARPTFCHTQLGQHSATLT